MKTKRLPLAIMIVLAAAVFVLAQGQRSPAPPEPRSAALQERPAIQESSKAPDRAIDQALVNAAGALDIVPIESKARYRVREQLANMSFPIDAVGETHGVTGHIAFDEDGNVLSGASWITVDLALLQSDQQRRDNFVKRNTLQTDRYPQAVFVPTEIAGLPHPLPESGEAEVTILGDLTIRGVTRPVEWMGTAVFRPDGMNVEAQTVLTFQQFEIEKPRVALVLSVEDEIRLEADIRFEKNDARGHAASPSDQAASAS